MLTYESIVNIDNLYKNKKPSYRDGFLIMFNARALRQAQDTQKVRIK